MNLVIYVVKRSLGDDHVAIRSYEGMKNYLIPKNIVFSLEKNEGELVSEFVERVRQKALEEGIKKVDRL
ncbi:hypothetical protein GOV10_04515 [Candidatus Woesearchaeota archaeon]|nr:hypothetical protein [Candidatus Woesearchaeota archaeon]